MRRTSWESLRQIAIEMPGSSSISASRSRPSIRSTRVVSRAVTVAESRLAVEDRELAEDVALAQLVQHQALARDARPGLR